jgi:hypothetical protein
VSSDPTVPIADPVVSQIIEPLYRARVWMRFLAVLGFIVGGLYAISIIGLIVAWLPILVGAFVWQAANAIETAYATSSAADARRGLDRLRLVFVTYGILAAVSIGLFLFLFVAGIGFSLLGEGERVMR